MIERMREAIAALIERMESDLARLVEAGDARRFFHATYLRTTRAVGEEIERGGFLDGDWLERWDIVFADLYLAALEADLRGDAIPEPWRVAFATARTQPQLPPLRHVLLGMNAHINYDLPQALVAVITPAEFDDPVVRRRRADDHAHVDDVLLARVSAEDVELEALGPRTWLDRVLTRLSRIATKRLLREARAKVWHNAILLDRARRAGREPEILRRLERASAAKLVELTESRQVLLRLAVRGFGVRA